MLSSGSIYSFLDPVILTKTRAVDISAIHERAMNDFKGRFGRVKPETWYQVAGGWISYLQTDESEHRGFYTKKEHWKCSLSFYYENFLSNAIRALAKSNYYDYRITMVEELSGPNAKTYILHLENE